MAVKKATAAGAAEGIWVVVLAEATVAMALADNSSNGRAGNRGRNRGSGGATTINQYAAAVEVKTAVVVTAMDVAAACIHRLGVINS